jgi:hypothetical protein
VHDNLIHYFRRRPETFPLRGDLDLRQFLSEVGERTLKVLPVPAKIFLVDELEPHGYGFSVARAKAIDDLEVMAGKWIAEEIAVRGGTGARSGDLLAVYRDHLARLCENAVQSSILADYHSVLWLLHSQHVARLFAAVPRKAMQDLPGCSREDGSKLKYAIFSKWTASMREMLAAIGASSGFTDLLHENPLISSEESITVDMRELRDYFSGHLHRDFKAFRDAFESLRQQTADVLSKDRLFRRAIMLLGYPEAIAPPFVSLLDPRVQQLVADHPSFRPAPDHSFLSALSRKLLEAVIVHNLRRGIVWMKTTADGDNVAEEDEQVLYSRAIRPMNFGRRGVVEPVVFRYGLVYDITSFTQTLGEIARGGKGEEQSGYRQMLEFQRELADISRRFGLQFEKFLGDGAFYTSRRAMRVVQAAVEIQRYYARAKANGFVFNKGMRIALNYGYYRLLPMQVSSDGAQIMEFYGPGIVELSRLTTGKATKEIEDIQHLLLTHGYDQNDVLRFFAPLSRISDPDAAQQQREFYAYVNESGHLINEGIVVSIPFIQQLSTELAEEGQKLYRLRTPWAVYLGFGTASDYVGLRLIGSVSLKGIGMQEVAEVVRLGAAEAEISVLEDPKPLTQLLQQERNRSAARNVAASIDGEVESTTADLVVCEAHTGTEAMILVGEWDPVSEEVRRPIQLDGMEAERYGLSVPLSAQRVEQQSTAYQNLYRKLSRIETLPSISAEAIRHNANFSGFIIGATVEPL